MVRFADVYKSYDNGTKALKGIDLRIDDGEFVFLVGPSGSGKSTVVKLITAEVRPTDGKMLVNGFNFSNLRTSQIPRLRRTLGVVFQDFRLIENMTVYENVAFAMRVIGEGSKRIRERVPIMLELVGLSHKAKRYPRELSGGEQQRVSIARALCKNPALLLCDEPTGALDSKTGVQVLALLKDVCRTYGATVVIITHNAMIAPLGSRVIRVKNGGIESIETCEHPAGVGDIAW